MLLYFQNFRHSDRLDYALFVTFLRSYHSDATGFDFTCIEIIMLDTENA
ncbi:hypothetical protein H1Q63_29005 [Desmonostoc muscorum CCALA 125]|nr:hypothetical protein [Desmonostoc muscorum CCALA 125]